MHYHINQRLNDGEPVPVHTDEHSDCCMEMLEDLIRVLPLVGYRLSLDEELPRARSLVFVPTDENAYTIRFTLWACSCSTGEFEMRQRSARYAAPLN